MERAPKTTSIADSGSASEEGRSGTLATAPAPVFVVRKRSRSAHSAPPRATGSSASATAPALEESQLAASNRGGVSAAVAGQVSARTSGDPVGHAVTSDSPPWPPPVPGSAEHPMAPRSGESSLMRLPTSLIPLRRSNSLSRGFAAARKRSASPWSGTNPEPGDPAPQSRQPASTLGGNRSGGGDALKPGGSNPGSWSDHSTATGNSSKPKSGGHTLPALPTASRMLPRMSSGALRPVNALKAAAAAVSGYGQPSGRSLRGRSWSGSAKTVPTDAPASTSSSSAPPLPFPAPGPPGAVPSAPRRVSSFSQERDGGGRGSSKHSGTPRSERDEDTPAAGSNSTRGLFSTASLAAPRKGAGRRAGYRADSPGENGDSSAMTGAARSGALLPPPLPKSVNSPDTNTTGEGTGSSASASVPSFSAREKSLAEDMDDSPVLGSPVAGAVAPNALRFDSNLHSSEQPSDVSEAAHLSESAKLIADLSDEACGESDRGSWGSASLENSPNACARSPPLSPLGTAQRHMHGLKPMGLQNLGNTCFLNAAVQALAHAPLLAPFYLQGHFVTDLNAANPLGTGGVLAAAFAALLQKLFPSGSSSSSSSSSTAQPSHLAPDDFYEAVCKCFFLIGEQRGEQQDAHEVMNFLLDALHEDVNRIRQRPAYKERQDLLEDELSKKGEERFAAEFWHDHLQRHRSKIVDLCQGQLRSQVKCVECGEASVTYDPFLFLSLPLPQGLKRGGKARIEDAINAFCAEERLDGDNRWGCPRCKKRVSAFKRISLWKLPMLLFVHYKRFGFEAANPSTLFSTPARAWKIEGEVSLPLERLDLQDRMAETSPQRVPLQYDLFAVVDHVGASASVGHYTAACRRDDGWWRFDDSRTEFLGKHEDGVENRILGEGNYLLLFQRRDAPPEPQLVREQSHKKPEHWPHVRGDGVEWSFLQGNDDVSMSMS